MSFSIKVAMTYSPTNICSTIGAVGLNFSVRDGKRWIPDAINRLNKCKKALTCVQNKDSSYHVIQRKQSTQTTFKRTLSKAVRYASKLMPQGNIPCGNKSFRAISTARLNTSLCVHLQPINVVVYNDPYEEI